MIGDILQPTHLLFILVIALLVLGPKRLPEVGRSLGRGIRDFRAAVTGDDDESPEVPASTATAETAPAPAHGAEDLESVAPGVEHKAPAASTPHNAASSPTEHSG